MPTSDSIQRIRVVIQQPALPKYRLPVFRELSRRQGIDLKLFYGQVPDITNVASDGFAAECVPMRRFRILGRSLLWHAPQWRCATRSAADVLILSWNLHYLSLVPALLRARKNGVRTILWGHGYSKHEAAWRAWPRRKVAQLADALLFYNHTAAQTYLDAGWDPKRIFVALNALDQAPIQAARHHWLGRPDELQRFKQEHGLADGPVILFVSRFDAARRADLLLRAVTQLRSRYPSIRVVLVGKGEPEGERLRALATSLNIVEHVQFPGAIYDEQQLAPWFLSSTAFCFPADVGLSLLHAFGYGLPVVTHDELAAHAPEVEALRPGENGLLYRHGDADALAATLNQLFDDPARLAAMSAAAHRTATEQFTLTNMVDGMEAAIKAGKN